ncbi:hypothetical protein L211DRAFT_852715 [Terfezia boudieri ATCC MYA-4762]|uniref:Uncharacterized protein n=1 Tax=Terfezia boudieri ATCC MYA-4762 TaxID=1051890 RepID=A0A3N4LPV2_9PEZI|nr:hypothetical protein L211DRAFT_852715 [Terfezia boudieri ATCC MYA-4762]
MSTSLMLQPAHSSPSTYDLRTRTLTYILSAFNDSEAKSRVTSTANTSLKPNPVAVSHEKDLHDEPYMDTQSGTYRVCGAPHVDTRWLKLLNQVAQLLVREHEIVAVLPKRSGPLANLSIMVTTDSDTDRDASVNIDVNVVDSPDVEVGRKKQEDFGYFVTRNPRRGSTPIRQDILEALQEVDTPCGMLAHLNAYRQISFTNHVSCVEQLLNNIISSHGSTREESVTLFRRYITFRAAPKIHRRFSKSPAFKSFIHALHNIDPSQIPVARIGEIRLTRYTVDYELVGTILFNRGFPKEKCPSLWYTYNHKGSVPVYNGATAGEFHQLLLFCLEMAQRNIADLTKKLKEDNGGQVTEAMMLEAEGWMKFLHIMVHESNVFQVHIQALDELIATSIVSNTPGEVKAPLLCAQWIADGRPAKREPPQYGNPTTENYDMLAPQEENIGMPTPDTTTSAVQDSQDIDTDGGISDTAIEINAAQTISRVVQRSLWLAVSYQQAIISLTSRRALPKSPISLTLWESPHNSIEESKQMANWTEVIRSICGKTT